MKKKNNILRFEFIDNQRECPEKTFFEKHFNVDEDDDPMPIEEYYYFCKFFAAAYGYTEKTIEEWFGNY